MNRRLIFLLLTILSLSCAGIFQKGPDYYQKNEAKIIKDALKRTQKCIRENISPDYQGPVPVNSKVDSVTLSLFPLQLNIHLSRHFSAQPFRTENVTHIYELFGDYLGGKFDNFAVSVLTLDRPIQDLIPNFYRSERSEYDVHRMPRNTVPAAPIIRNLSKAAWRPTLGLSNRHLALWHSHGFYYSFTRGRWEWQRPRLFNTVEDLLSMSFVIPYLVPMLENSGATVFLPRERDLQTHEVIVDNDSPSVQHSYREINPAAWHTGLEPAFAIGSPPYPANLNPFALGSYRFCVSDSMDSAGIEYIPDIPESGMYGICVAYHASDDNATDVHYRVHHSGGVTDFAINQQMGGSTWLYLGQFHFEAGFRPETGKVVLSNRSHDRDKIISGDAVRFGGGMGNILRNGEVSGYPRFAEAARYYLQYAGLPDTLVYHLNRDSTDYNDDYQCRGEYVNYLKGRPFGPNRDRTAKGLGIPMDLSLAFHTDAGIDSNDASIGTLLIYSITDAETLDVFPDSMSRLANRDLADIMQTEIVDVIQRTYWPDWVRRDLRNATYSEAWRPNVPACLLELLSHQNYADMKYALSPQYRFDVSRAIYKSMLKFISAQLGSDYAVQPLPVSHFHAFFSDAAEITLRWQPVSDPLEESARPSRYVVYRSIDGFGFDNGTLVPTNAYVVNNLERSRIYRFMVTAVNDGGESFPSEILSVAWLGDEAETVLIVNGFDRLSPPEVVESRAFKGFLNLLDPGVPYHYDFNFTGPQIDFEPHSPFRSNDAPGHGASMANFETKIIRGNSFDYPSVHGAAILDCGHSFVSCSDEAVMAGLVDLKSYPVVDLILGEEKTTPFPPKLQEDARWDDQYRTFPDSLQKRIADFCMAGGNLFVSGAYVATDLLGHGDADHGDSLFAHQILRMNWETDHAASTGSIVCVDSTFHERFAKFTYNVRYDADIYAVESPDAVDPVNGARTILRYAENRFSAATAYQGDYSVIIFGFPFETVVNAEQRHALMKAVLTSFTKGSR